MNSLVISGFGTHSIGVPNFNFMSIVRFTDGSFGTNRIALWSRLPAEPTEGVLRGPFNDFEVWEAYCKVFLEQREVFLKEYVHYAGQAPLKQFEFEIRGDLLADFAESRFTHEQQGFFDHVGMPIGLAQTVAKGFWRNLK